MFATGFPVKGLCVFGAVSFELVQR